MTRIGIMSFAHTHAISYAGILKNTPGVAVMASDPGGHSPAEQRGRALAEDLGIDYAEDYEDLLGWDPDGIIVTSENSRHRADVELASSKCHQILCEKPLATTWRDGTAIRECIERHHANLMVAYPVRFSPAFSQLQHEDLGDIIAIRANNNGMLPKDRAWFTDPQLAGGGALVDHIVHSADLIDALTGTHPTRVTATSNRILHPDTPAETAGMALVEYDHGPIAAIDCSWSVPQGAPSWGGLQISVLGTRGTVDIDFFNRAARGVDQDGKSLEIRYGPNLDDLMIAEFLRGVRAQTPSEPSIEVGLRTLSIMLAAQESAKTGRAVSIADFLATQ